TVSVSPVASIASPAFPPPHPPHKGEGANGHGVGSPPSGLQGAAGQHPEGAFAESRPEGRTANVQGADGMDGPTALRPSRRPSGPPQDVEGGTLQAEKPVLAADLAFGPAGSRIAMQLRPGEIVGLYGLVGAGRSSLLRTLWGA